MHWKDLRAHGETGAALYGLTPGGKPVLHRTRARRAHVTEAVTRITDGHASDADYEAVRQHFDGKELADLTFVIATINAWNRLAIAGRTSPGTYQPRATSGTSA
jgi:alkylhydroperoxidase family enzyme